MVRSKAPIAIQPFCLIQRTQSVKPLNRSGPKKLPFVPQFLGADRAGEALRGNNLPKVATHNRIVARPEREPSNINNGSMARMPEC